MSTSSTSGAYHLYTYTNPVNHKEERLTKEQQNTIIAVTVVFGILTGGLLVLPLLFGLSAHFKNQAIRQIQQTHNATVAKTHEEMQGKLQIQKEEHTPQNARLAAALNRKIPFELAKRKESYRQLIEKKNAGKPFTLVEAKTFLEYQEYKSLARAFTEQYHPYQQQELAQESKERQEVQEYFESTRQSGGYSEIEQAAKRSVLLAFMENVDVASLTDPLTSTQSKAIRNLAMPIINNIEEKKDHHPSITGDKRDIYTVEDLQILNFIKNLQLARSSPWKQHLHPELKIEQISLIPKANELIKAIENRIEMANRFSDDYIENDELLSKTSLDDLLDILAKPVSELNPKEARLVVNTQHVWLEIQKNQGAYLDLALLPQLDTMRRVNELRSEQIDLAKMQLIIREHDKAQKHFRVGLEGGGPVGLLMAITQFEAGAKVSLFEKRSTQYDRTQIVKLDPMWMSALQYYLGEEYYKIFSDPEHRGIIRSDGFGEIATLFLEEAIHTRLTQLMSLLPGEGNDLPLERLASYEVVGVHKPKKHGGKYSITATYQPQYDPVGKTPGIAEATEKTVKRKIDMLICAGGKSSPMKQRLLPSSSAVTEEAYYGVCSWLADDIYRQDKDKMNLFQDFRNMVHLDETFFDSFASRLRSEFRIQNEASTITKDNINHSTSYRTEEEALRENNVLAKYAILDYVRESFPKVRATERTHLQTRTFENRGLIYIGMEMPTEMKDFLDGLEKNLQSYTSFKLSPAEIASVKKQMQKLWFQQVMHYYGMDSSADLTIDKIDTKFAATFPVDQYRIDPEHLVSEIKHDSSKLLVTAAGDAFSSPHFMRYSGLTGGRENIFHLQEYTKGVAHKHKKRLLLDTLKGHMERTAQFVIGRGRQFLKPLSDFQIRANRKEAIVASIEQKKKELFTDPYAEYQLHEDPYSRGYYLVGHHQYHLVKPKAGYVRIDGQRYDSIDQFLLQL